MNSTLEVESGDLTITANEGQTIGGDFTGVFIHESQISTLGAGSIRVNGSGGTGDENFGIGITRETTISSVGSGINAGRISLVGFGNPGSSDDSPGISFGSNIFSNVEVVTLDGDIEVVGSTIAESDRDHGVLVMGSTLFETTGRGNITIRGESIGQLWSAGNGIEWDRGTVNSTSGTADAGNVLIEGSSNDGNGIYLGSFNAVTNHGDISISGHGRGFRNAGIAAISGTNIQSVGLGPDAGDVHIHGIASDTDAAKLELFVSTIDGDIKIQGEGGGREHGILSRIFFEMESTGEGAIAVEGTGADVGIWLDRPRISSSQGPITITGTSDIASTGSLNHGVFLGGGTVTSSGADASAAPITIQGTSGGGLGHGVRFTSPLISSVNGAIEVQGRAGLAINSVRSSGVEMGAAEVRSTGIGEFAAPITIVGVGGEGIDSMQGVQLKASMVSTIDGDISVVGTGNGDASGAGVVLVASTIQSTGTDSRAGSITIQGTGGGEGDNGVTIEGPDSRIQSVDGHITINGNAPSPSTGNGVQIHLGGFVESTNGLINIAGETNAAAGSGVAIDALDGPGVISARTDPNSVVLTSNQGTISGGWIDADVVTLSGNVAPGFSDDPTARLLVDGSTSLPGGHSLNLEFAGIDPTEYDQLAVTGALDIEPNVTLQLAAIDNASGSLFVPTGGEVFVIVERGGGSGNFSGLPEGAAIPDFLASGLTATISYLGGDGDDIVLTVEPAPTRIIGRHVFYNDSAFDDGPAANASDDNALAPDKVPLLPSETANDTNFTSSVDGITGLMLDIAGLPTDATLDAATDFVFRVGNDDEVSTWTELSASDLPEISIREGAGSGGTDRITLTWPPGTITNTWLEVTVKANAETGLAEDDVFYFGNQIGDTNGDGLTNATDFQNVRSNPRNFLNPAAVDNLFDINRDGRVNAADLAIVRDHATGIGEGLPMITPTGSALLKSGGFQLILPEEKLSSKGKVGKADAPAAEVPSIGSTEADFVDLAILAEYEVVTREISTTHVTADDHDQPGLDELLLSIGR